MDTSEYRDWREVFRMAVFRTWCAHPELQTEKGKRSIDAAYEHATGCVWSVWRSVSF
jgi:hypothetical protein